MWCVYLSYICSSFTGCCQQWYADSKTVHQQNPPVINRRCRLTQVDLYNGHITVVVVVLLYIYSTYDAFSGTGVRELGFMSLQAHLNSPSLGSE